ncbi:LOW QUALITY PROTEIN: hypothetical protein NC651_024720 [Populus alba x Populus x berolinensis]|nr:LOW QUALITY PROTEIN: hypothetical protein NC651_024720 [Populus alba x Populus x berolinensis]
MKREGSGSRGKGRQTQETFCSWPGSSSNSIKISLSKVVELSGMANYAIEDAYSSNPESRKVYMHERNSSTREGMQEVASTTEVLTRVDWDLAYSSKKLVNLHVLLVHLLARDNNLEARMATENSYILAIAIEKALEFDLLSGILDSETLNRSIHCDGEEIA